MSWNYRVIQYRDGSGYGLHEVYYRDDGEPRAMSADPVRFMVYAEEGRIGLVKSLIMALRDARRLPVLADNLTLTAHAEPLGAVEYRGLIGEPLVTIDGTTTDEATTHAP